jgi:hypothetical protein
MENGMRLVDLDPIWLQWRKESVDPTVFVDGVMHPSGERTLYEPVETLAEAHGIRFTCPLCVDKGGHGVICWFEGKVPDEARPGPGRWTPSGNGFDDLTFVPGARIAAVSVALHGGCNWHGFIRSGEVTLC